jgi:hypothetical protein
MAAVLGDNATKLASTIGANTVDAGYNKAVSKIMFDTYTAAALAAGSTITMCDKLPVGAVIFNIRMINAALGASSTISIGDAASAARYLPATSTAAAAVVNMSVQTGFGYKITGTNDTQIILTTAGASITGLVVLQIEYSI